MENTRQDNIKKLIEFAAQHNLKLSLVDGVENNYLLPGKSHSPEQLTQLIENSRSSAAIAMDDAHQLIRSAYDGGLLHEGFI